MFFALGLTLTMFSACNLIPQLKPNAKTPNESSAADESSSSAVLERGTWSDDDYTNGFAGLQFTLPEGWIAATDEEIANLMGVAIENFGDKQKWLVESAKLTTIYDMMAQDSVTGNSVIVMFENLSMSIGGMRMDEEAYFDAAKKQLEAVDTLSYTFNEPYDTTVGDTVYYTVRTDESTKNLSQYYMMHKQDKYMTVMIVTIIDDTKIDDIIAQFK